MALGRLGDALPPKSAPAVGAVAVTCSDADDIVAGVIPRGLSVATSGNYKLTMYDDTVVTAYLSAGIIHSIRVVRVWATDAASTSGVVAWL